MYLIIPNQLLHNPSNHHHYHFLPSCRPQHHYQSHSPINSPLAPIPPFPPMQIVSVFSAEQYHIPFHSVIIDPHTHLYTSTQTPVVPSISVSYNHSSTVPVSYNTPLPKK